MKIRFVVRISIAVGMYFFIFNILLMAFGCGCYEAVNQIYDIFGDVASCVRRNVSLCSLFSGWAVCAIFMVREAVSGKSLGYARFKSVGKRILFMRFLALMTFSVVLHAMWTENSARAELGCYSFLVSVHIGGAVISSFMLIFREDLKFIMSTKESMK